jgi:hypothetical protein
LTPSDEYSYDLLPWAVENYTKSLLDNSTEEKKYKPLTDYINSLTNHFRASPALIRFGACICLHSALNVYPGLVEDNPNLMIYIMSGVLDSDYLSSFLYLTILDTIFLNRGNKVMHNLVARYRHEEVVQGKEGEIDITHIMDFAAGGCPPIAPRLLHRIVNSLEYLSTPLKIKQIELVRLWGGKSEKVVKFSVYNVYSH